MKRAELAFAIFSVILDFLMILLAAFLAYFIRFQSYVSEIRPVVYALPFSEYLIVVLIMAASWLILFGIAGLYSLRGPKRMATEFSQIFLGCSTGILAVILTIFFRKEELFSSRFIIIALWILSILTVVCGRLLLRAIKRTLYRRSIGVHRVAIIGNDKTTHLIIDGIKQEPSLGYSIVKNFKDIQSASYTALDELIRSKSLDDLFIADPNLSKEEILSVKSLCDEFHVTFRYAADLFDAQATNIDITPINAVPVIEIKKTPLDGWGRILKRIFDMFFSVFAIILLSPILFIAAIAIKLESRGPIIYKNERVRKEGTFFVYKFRSMHIKYCTGDEYSNGQAEALEAKLVKERSERVGPVYKVLNDPRRTKVGRFLEKTSIDELPQFFNVLIGNMSVVGPRPHQPREVARYERRHKRLFSLKPGITGLAQISGRSELNFEDEFRLDTYYIENWSIGLDLYIILKTPLVLLRGHKGE